MLSICCYCNKIKMRVLLVFALIMGCSVGSLLPDYQNTDDFGGLLNFEKEKKDHIDSAEELPVIYIQTINATNLLSNGDFEGVEIPSGKLFAYIMLIPGWKEVTGKFGYGKHFSPYWDPETVVMGLSNSSSKHCTTEFQAQGGPYEVSFDWVAGFNESFGNSAFSIYVNSVFIKSILPIDYGVHRESIVIDTIDGKNILQFHTTGTEDHLGASVDNVAVVSYRGDKSQQNYVGQQQNYAMGMGAGGGMYGGGMYGGGMYGGGMGTQDYFQTTGGGSDQFFLGGGVKKGNFSKNYNFEGWQDTRTELSQGHTFNSKWGNSVVAHLDIGRNINYILPLNLDPTNYLLTFDWAAHQGSDLKTSQLQVRWNGQIAFRALAGNYDIYQQAVVFAFHGNKTINLQFVGAGPADKYGATIDNIQINNLYADTSQAIYQLLRRRALFVTSMRKQNLVINGNFADHGGSIQLLHYMNVIYINYWMVSPSNKYSAPVDQELHREDNGNTQAENRLLNLSAEYTYKFKGSQIMYQLSFDIQCPKGYDLAICEFRVHFNRKEVVTKKPTDHQKQHYTFLVVGQKSTNYLSFQAEGKSRLSGPKLSNVVMHEFNFRYRPFTASDLYRGIEYKMDFQELTALEEKVILAFGPVDKQWMSN